MPFFSVVIPVFNRQSLITETLNSVLSQHFADFEMIVVDDGSTDDTRKILFEKFGAHPKLSIITQENKERGAARNNGFRNAKGNYVVFFDSDDIMHRDHLETLHENILKTDLPEFISTKFQIKRKNKITFSDSHPLAEGVYDYRLFLNGNPLACNVCVKKNTPDLKLFEEDPVYAILEDWMFFLQNLRHHQLFLVDKVTITMNDHDNRSMQSDHHKIIQKKFLAFEWIKNNIELNDHDQHLLEAHVNYFCGIHSYAAHQRKAALRFVQKAVHLNGWTKNYLILFLKTLVGHRILTKFR